MTVPPAVTLAGPDLVTDRSADAFTVVFAVSVLFAGTGSAVVEAMLTALDRAVAWFGAVTTTVNVVDEPAAQVARVHVAEVLPLLLHDQPPFDGVTDPNTTPAGRVSTTETFAASEGPAFAAFTVYVTVPPAVTVAGPDLVTDKSADAITVVLAVSVLLPGVGSGVVDETVAELVSEAAWFGAVTTTVNVVDEPAAHVARVHVAEVLPLLPHNQPPFDGDTDTNETPAGRVSTIETLSALDGPRLSTTME